MAAARPDKTIEAIPPDEIDVTLRRVTLSTLAGGDELVENAAQCTTPSPDNTRDRAIVVLVAEAFTVKIIGELLMVGKGGGLHVTGKYRVGSKVG